MAGPSNGSAPASTSDEAKQRVAGFFSNLAPVYGTVLDFFDHFGSRLVDLAEIKPGMRVLDVAAGRGAAARPARDRGAEVVPVDIAEGMVASLREQGFDAARVMDGEALDLPDDSFDAVTCAFGIFFFPDPVAGAREFKRVVRPGGPVACSMPMQVFPEHVLALRREFEARADGQAMPNPRADFDGAAVLRAAGFEEVTTLDEEREFAFDSPEMLWEFVDATGARELRDRLRPSDQAELRERVMAGAPAEPFRLTMSARFWLANG